MTKLFKPTDLRIILIISLSIVMLGIIAGYSIKLSELGNSSNQVNSLTPNHTTKEVQDLIKYIDDSQNAISSVNNLIPLGDAAKDKVASSIDKAAASTSVKISSKSYVKPTEINNLRSVGILTTDYVTLTISNPVNYENLLKFIEAIENSTPKMQIMNIEITPNSNAEQVTIAPITIGYYKR